MPDAINESDNDYEYMLTPKQNQIVRLILKGSRAKREDGEFSPCDMYEILRRLPYRTTRDSLQFSLRLLVKYDYIRVEYHRRNNRVRKVLFPTEKSIARAESIDRLCRE